MGASEKNGQFLGIVREKRAHLMGFVQIGDVASAVSKV